MTCLHEDGVPADASPGPDAVDATLHTNLDGTRRSVSHRSTSPQDLLEDALPDEQTPKKKKKKSKKKPLNWKSNNIDLYVNESMTAANEIKAVVEKMKENLSKAEAILDTWSVQPLLKRSGKAQPVDDFEQLQKVTLKERYDVIKRGGARAAFWRGAFLRRDSYR